MSSLIVSRGEAKVLEIPEKDFKKGFISLAYLVHAGGNLGHYMRKQKIGVMHDPNIGGAAYLTDAKHKKIMIEEGSEAPIFVFYETGSLWETEYTLKHHPGV